MRWPVAIVISLCMVAVVAQPASADRSRRKVSREAETPWSRGISKDDQRRALQLFRDGNVLLEQSRYTEAVARYERALEAWDHPNIRYNMAFCLINMRQPLAAWTHLQQALRFGEAPLGERIHAEAMRTVAILESSLAQLTVTSSQPGIRVLVDGDEVLSGPGEHTMKLLAGRHQVVATRRGHITESRALDLPAGKPVVERIALARVKVRVLRENYERRWSWWVPWSVAGSSIVLGLAGGGFYLSARSDIDDYDRTLAQMCPSGCADDEIPPSLKEKEQAGKSKSGVAIGLWGVGGALAITGGVMAILNRPRLQRERRVTPLVTVLPDYIGLGVALDLD